MKKKKNHPAQVKTRALAKVETSKMALAPVTEKAIKEYLFGIDAKFTDDQKNLFICTALEYGLNPIKREIHAVPYEINAKNPQTGMWESTGRFKMNIVVGYGAYLKRAERTRDLEYWVANPSGSINWTNLEMTDFKCTVIIKRRSWQREFTWETKFTEVCPRAKKDGKISLHSTWLTQPEFQTKKCAISQAFRIAFPDDVGGMPYTDAEPQEMVAERNITGSAEVVQQNDEHPKKIFPSDVDLSKPLIGGLYEGKMFDDIPVNAMMQMASVSATQKEEMMKRAEKKVDALNLQAIQALNFSGTELACMSKDISGQDENTKMNLRQKISLQMMLLKKMKDIKARQP